MSDRHVIKGRGKNRGKYLCWARTAPLEKATEDGFVWLPKQREAVRWDDPRYSGRTWATDRASLHNGYFVKLVAAPAIIKRVDELRSYISEHAAGSEEKLACYWLSEDGGSEYCHDCIVKLVAGKVPVAKGEAPWAVEDDGDDEDEDAIDGGFDIDHDSPPYCETCGADLSGNLTEYGADQEIEALTGDGAPTFDDAHGWRQLDDALVNVSNDDPRWCYIARIVDAAEVEEKIAAEAATAFSALPGMSEARAGFLALLAARSVQKAPEPSYLLWDEFQAWMLVRRDETPETKATEKRLFKEAISFLGFCGIRAYMTNGGMGMAAAPHGTYYWPFIVETEQRKLWKDVDLAAGRAVGLACLASDDAPGRDASPFNLDGADAPRARAWDDGFLLGLHEASGGCRATEDQS